MTLARSSKVFALVSLFVLGACASSEESRELMEAPGYQAGYGDGCITATEQDKSFSTKRERDAYAFDNDRAYRAGWRQGYIQCGGRTAASSDGGLILGDDRKF